VWNDFESESVAGRYQLGKLVRSEGRYGWFETSFQGKPAIVSLIESLNDEDDLLERLRVAEKVHHPNVAAILETGTAKVNDTPLVYAVMEFTEENLEDVLRTRALSAEETKQVAESLVGALAAIHKERLVCGEMEDSSVLAAGDTIKLRSDRLHSNSTASDAAFQSLAAKDVQALGILLYRCLTQKSPSMNGNDPSIQLLPQPFVQVVRKALSEKATTDEIAALLRPRPSAATTTPPPATSPSAATTTPPPATSPAAATTTPPAESSKPVSAKPDEKKLPLPEKRLPLPVSLSSAEDDDDDTEGSESSGRKTWLVAGIVLVLVIVGFALKISLFSSKNASQPTPRHNAAASNPAPASAPPADVPSPSTASSSPAPAAVQPAPPPPAEPPPSMPAATPVPGKNAIWRVVAFTYNHQDQAEHKVHTINQTHPDLQAEVFSPKGSGRTYLVTLGGWMERDAAFRFVHKAVLEGLPHDTYAQNYPH
jgi:hypothetical protein